MLAFFAFPFKIDELFARGSFLGFFPPRRLGS